MRTIFPLTLHLRMCTNQWYATTVCSMQLIQHSILTSACTGRAGNYHRKCQVSSQVRINPSADIDDTFWFARYAFDLIV